MSRRSPLLSNRVKVDLLNLSAIATLAPQVHFCHRQTLSELMQNSSPPNEEKHKSLEDFLGNSETPLLLT